MKDEDAVKLAMASSIGIALIYAAVIGYQIYSDVQMNREIQKVQKASEELVSRIKETLNKVP